MRRAPWKAVAVGVPLCVAVCYAVVHLEMVVGWQVAILQFPPVAVGVLFILALLNWGLKAATGRAPLGAADLVVIYTMVCIASLISNRNQTGIFTICLPSLNYFADAANNWRERLFPLVRPWLVPFDVVQDGEPGPIRQLVVRRYFEGLRAGEHVPWADWAVPLLCWSALMLSVLFAFLFMAALLRRPWVEPIHGTVEEVVPNLPPRPDAVILDPPRGGCTKEALLAVLRAKPKAIVYVSCDPPTFARDAAVLREGGYKLEWVEPLDMFPHTHHVELVARFSASVEVLEGPPPKPPRFRRRGKA